MNGEPSAMVSPGIWGFVAFFVLAVALYLLMRNMNARMRRMSYRAEELQREAEGKQRPEGDAGEPDAAETGDGAPAQEQTEDPGQQPGTQSQS
jgi:flagellar biosynthesis/type III secretory pathway M-ring protein FliF/YscJ